MFVVEYKMFYDNMFSLVIHKVIPLIHCTLLLLLLIGRLVGWD